MRTITTPHVYYDKEDCEALDRMSPREVADILEGIEGTWMPSRPNAYYSLTNGTAEEAEFDFDLLRAIKAVDLAARMLRKAYPAENENKKERK